MAVVLNLDRLLSKLDNLKEIQINEALEEACFLVENDAKRKCPVDTGQLRASITHEVDDKVGVIGTNVEYAPYVEYGTGIFAVGKNGRQDRWSYKDAEGNWHTTVGQKPQPYLEPALLDNRQNIKNIFKNKVKEEMKDV